MREMYEESESFHELHALIFWMFKAVDGPRYEVKPVASDLNISTDALYAYIRGTLPFPAYLLPALFNSTHEQRLLNWMALNCKLVISRLETISKPNGLVNDDLDETMVSAFELFKANIEAVQDGVIDKDERKRLYEYGMRHMQKLQGLLVELAIMPEEKNDEHDKK